MTATYSVGRHTRENEEDRMPSPQLANLPEVLPSESGCSLSRLCSTISHIYQIFILNLDNITTIPEASALSGHEKNEDRKSVMPYRNKLRPNALLYSKCGSDRAVAGALCSGRPYSILLSKTNLKTR